MRYLKYLALLGIFMLAASSAQAQVSVGIGIGPGYIGPPPTCVYGYYDHYPYACAPYGYYGPDYFIGGVFIGAGPWFRGYYRPRDYRYYGRGYFGRGYYGWGRDRDDFRRGRDRDFRGFRGEEFHGGRSGEFRSGRGGSRGGGSRGGGHR